MDALSYCGLLNALSARIEAISKLGVERLPLWLAAEATSSNSGRSRTGWKEWQDDLIILLDREWCYVVILLRIKRHLMYFTRHCVWLFFRNGDPKRRSTVRSFCMVWILHSDLVTPSLTLPRRFTANKFKAHSFIGIIQIASIHVDMESLASVDKSSVSIRILSQ